MEKTELEGAFVAGEMAWKPALGFKWVHVTFLNLILPLNLLESNWLYKHLSALNGSRSQGITQPIVYLP